MFRSAELLYRFIIPKINATIRRFHSGLRVKNLEGIAVYYRTAIVPRNILVPQNTTTKHFSTTHSSFAKRGSSSEERKKSTVYYVLAIGVLTVGFTYAAVPLYRLFCQAYSYGGTTSANHDSSGLENIETNRNRIIRVRFNADTSSTLTWNFKPQQREIKVALGETALAFYTATNPTDRPIDGISTYNVVPFEAGQYFNKIQCFCFEEQRLNPHEQVDMPVFFYIDPALADDPRMERVESITLSYTFFEAKEGVGLQLLRPS